MEEENGRALGHQDKMGFDGKDFEQNMCACTHGLKKQDDEHDSRKRNIKQQAEAKTGG